MHVRPVQLRAGPSATMRGVLNAGGKRFRQAAASEDRVGVLGGTFDPVHNGHLHIAETLRKALGLTRIVWVPAGRPPHNQGQIVSSDEVRLEMLRLALAQSPPDEISLVDLERSGPSYTADTLE